MNGQTHSFLKDYLLTNGIDYTDILMFDDFLNSFKLGKYIINLDALTKIDENRHGTHFISLIYYLYPRNYKKTIFWFDSMGRKPHNLIINKCNEEKVSLFYNNIQFQDLKEKTCGLWACAFLAIIDIPDLTLNKINKNLNYLKNYEWK